MSRLFFCKVDDIKELPNIGERTFPIITDECKEKMLKNWMDYEGLNI